MNNLNILELGLVEYQYALKLQKKLVKERRNNSIPDTLLLLEHPDVITLGKQTKDKDVIEQSIPIVKIDRGGRATYHGPGQLIGYIIMDLKKKGITIPVLITKIHEILITTLREFNIPAERKESPGIWIDQKKIASIGLSVKNWITYHGFSLNINTDLDKFNMIRPCGFDGQIMTSIKLNNNKTISSKEIKSSVIKNFSEIFQYNEVIKN